MPTPTRDRRGAPQTVLQGLAGWNVPDALVVMTHSGYSPRQSHAHATFDKSMSSTGRDFRHLTPLVLMAALQRAGTQVCEPIDRFRVELPADTLGGVQAPLVRLGGVPEIQDRLDTSYLLLEGDIPAAQVHELRQLLPGLTRGEGVLD
jgi:ribosomal protection tetracycline resistance protein